MAEELKRIKVKSARDDNKVVLAEKHPAHPGGEVFIAGATRTVKDSSGNVALDDDGQPKTEDNVVEVAETPNVLKAIHQGQLVRVEEGIIKTVFGGGDKPAASKADAKK